MKKFWILLFLSVFLISCNSWKGTHHVFKVTDGDTLKAESRASNEKIICRLYGADAPETKKPGKPEQPYGEEAFSELKKMVLDKDVKITVINKDRYGRDVCQVNTEKLDVNLEMVKRGMAWAYVEYLKRPHASIYLAVEKEARDKKLGLWAERNPTPPWEFRKLQRGSKK
jgi:micrococcal nuclease